MTEHDWRQALAAVHPDRGGNADVFMQLSAAREHWRATHRRCLRCGRVFAPPLSYPKQRYHSMHCWNLARADQKRLRRLRTRAH